MLFVFTTTAHGQKLTNEFMLSGDQVDTLEINIEHYLEVNIQIVEQGSISIRSSREGEYFDALVITPIINSRTMTVRDPLSPTFTEPQDKLSAHKVMRGTISITLPEHIHLVFSANNAKTSIIGSPNSIWIEQLRGSIGLLEVGCPIQINTLSADVRATLTKGNVKAQSKTGAASLPVYLPDGPRMHIQSIHGNISVKATKN